MNQLAGTTFGIGSPIAYPGATPSWGVYPQVGPAQQLLQVLPQQLQQLQNLQQQQLYYIQQLLQIVPAQLQQLQQLIQIIPQQLQQQSQPFGQSFQHPIGLGFLPQTFSSPGPSHVM
ncbi:MAG TPA: hypothetical protein VGJ29_08030 [Vicinamibacterales bacterium]|jgi:hypothetical protein